MVSFSQPVGILNVVELVLSIIVSGLIAGLWCIACPEVYRQQFVSAVVYGYLIINLLVVIDNAMESSLGKNLRMITVGLGAVLWLCASALILNAADTTNCCSLGEAYDRAVAGGILALANFIAHSIDCFFVFKGNAD